MAYSPMLTRGLNWKPHLRILQLGQYHQLRKAKVLQMSKASQLGVDQFVELLFQVH